jgi:hypothetical protein
MVDFWTVWAPNPSKIDMPGKSCIDQRHTASEIQSLLRLQIFEWIASAKNARRRGERFFLHLIDR